MEGGGGGREEGAVASQVGVADLQRERKREELFQASRVENGKGSVCVE